jgi:hypothetical protein
MNNIIYISSSLERLEKKEERNISIYRDISLNNQVVDNERLYIPLTPAVYGWLRKQMDKAHMAYKADKLPADNWNSLRNKFYPLHDWAITTYGRKAIEKAISIPQKNPFNGQLQERHSEHNYPAIGEYSHAHPVTPAALAQVDAIKDKAINLGWQENALYQNRGHFSFPYGQDYGLICFIDKGSYLGEVTRQSIEIIGTSSKTLNFYNRDVEQPWVKKIG